MPKKVDPLVILDFETLSELGVLVTVNSRLLHPLGLAMKRIIETGGVVVI